MAQRGRCGGRLHSTDRASGLGSAMLGSKRHPGRVGEVGVEEFVQLRTGVRAGMHGDPGLA